MDTLGSLALTTDIPDLKILDRSPVKKNDPITNNFMWRSIVGTSIY